jgi:hypothetical protein
MKTLRRSLCAGLIALAVASMAASIEATRPTALSAADAAECSKNEKGSVCDVNVTCIHYGFGKICWTRVTLLSEAGSRWRW